MKVVCDERWPNLEFHGKRWQQFLEMESSERTALFRKVSATRAKHTRAAEWGRKGRAKRGKSC